MTEAETRRPQGDVFCSSLPDTEMLQPSGNETRGECAGEVVSILGSDE